MPTFFSHPLGRKKYLFGDGSYSGNILTPYTNSMGAIFGTMPGGGGAASCFDGTVNGYGGSATVVENAGAGYNGTWYGVGKTFTDPVKFTQAQIKAPSNSGFLSTAAYACSVRLQITEDGTNWSTFWSRTNSGGGVAEVITVDMTSSPIVKGIKAEVQSNGANGLWIAELVLTGSATLQPKVSYAPIITGSGSTITNMDVYSGAIANVFDGNNNTYLFTSSGAAASWTGMYIGKDFGTPVKVSRMYANSGSNGTNFCNSYNGTQVNLYYSDNGTTWYPAGVAVTTPHITNSTADIASTETGAHRYWVLRVYGDGTHSACVGEVVFYGESLPNCIVVTGAATVAPDAGTGASVFTAQNVVVDGASASLSPSTSSKGLIGIVSGSVRVMNGGRIHIDKLGKAGNFGNLTVLDLVPQSLKRKLKASLAAYVVLGEGAAGCVASNGGNLTGLTGSTASAMQTGGGGGGGRCGVTGAGGKGGPCCGGAGSGGSNSTTLDAGPYGGPGSAGAGGYQEAGGAGDPVGAGVNGAGSGKGPGGGLLMLFTPALVIASGCVVSADGAGGGDSGYGRGGGGAGGGCVALFTSSGGYANSGTVRANGGPGGAGASGAPGGPGGAGSVNTYTLAA